MNLGLERNGDVSAHAAQIILGGRPIDIEDVCQASKRISTDECRFKPSFFGSGYICWLSASGSQIWGSIDAKRSFSRAVKAIKQSKLVSRSNMIDRYDLDSRYGRMADM